MPAIAGLKLSTKWGDETGKGEGKVVGGDIPKREEWRRWTSLSSYVRNAWVI
jgi:hypothetical protein